MYIIYIICKYSYVEDFPNLGKDFNIQVHQANKHYYLNTRRPSPRHIVLKLLKKNQ